MAVDLAHARRVYPKARVADSTRDRGYGMAPDSLGALGDGADMAAGRYFSDAASFAAFTAASGIDSPDDTEQGVVLSVRNPDADFAHTFFAKSLPVRAPVQEHVIEAGFDGVTTAIVPASTTLHLGKVAVFPDIVQGFVQPDTVPDELLVPVVRYVADLGVDQGMFRFAPGVFDGWCQFEMHATIEVNTGLNAAIIWTIERTDDQLAPFNWSTVATLGEDSHNNANNPEAVNFKTKSFFHFKGSSYRIVFNRGASPAGDVTVELKHTIIRCTMKIRQP